jgi:hypothetical protein
MKTATILAELLTASISCRRHAPESEITCFASYRRLCAYPSLDACRILGRGRCCFTRWAIFSGTRPPREQFTTTTAQKQEEEMAVDAMSWQQTEKPIHTRYFSDPGPQERPSFTTGQKF